MTITTHGTGAYRTARPNEFVSSRNQFDDLQRQLSTGKRSESYGDLGIERRTSLDLNAKVASLDSWLKGVELAEVNLSLSVQSVQNFTTLTNETKNDVRSNSYTPSASGRSAPQVLAEEKFKQTLDLLNTDVNGRFLFSGRTSDVQPTAGFSEIVNGDGAGRAGLIDLITERKVADGATATAPVLATGRLTTTLNTATNTATVTRDGVNDAYGFRLGNPAATTNATGLVLTATPTPTAATSVAVAVVAQPLSGQTLSFRLTLPDGTTEDVVLTARAAATTGDPATTFVIGADEAETAVNLRATIENALGREARTSLAAASATVAAETLFAGSLNNPPKRVNTADYTLPPTADPTGTVIWYKGDDGAGTARATTTVQVDQSQLVATGARANEEAFRVGLAQFAVLAVETFPAADANSQARYEALTERVRDALGFGGTVQKPSEIIVEFGTAQKSIASAKERHEATKNYLGTTLAGIENVTTEEVAVQILAIQNRLQASYQTTAILSQLSLTNYL